VKKPEQQWETARFVAVRLPEVPPERAGEPAVQAFELRRRGGGPSARACFSLSRQVVDAEAADPDLEFAARAWLASRGARILDLRGPGGEVLAEGVFTLADLSQPAEGSARTLVSLCPSNAEILGALGAFERVLACEDSSDWPVEVERCERLGPDLGPDLDRVAALAPDLTLSSLSVPGMERNVTGLRVRGLRQRVLAPRSVDDVLAELRLVGEDLGLPERAAAVCEQMQAERAALQAARPESAGRGVPRVVAAADVLAGGRLLQQRADRAGGRLQRVRGAAGGQRRGDAGGAVGGRSGGLFRLVVRGRGGEARPGQPHSSSGAGGAGSGARRQGVPARRALLGAAGAADARGGAHHGAGDRGAVALRRFFVPRIGL
jgi:hypothetical protein